MKTLKSIVFILYILCSSAYTARSQNMIPNSDALLAKLRINKTLDGVKELEYSDISGSPFIFKNFHQGKLAMDNGEEYNILLRYDIYANEMHLKANDQIYAIFKPDRIKIIETDSIKFIYSPYGKAADTKTSDKASFFVVRKEGKCMLLIRKNIRIQDAEPPKIYQDAKPAKFINTSDTYYLKLENKNAVLIKGKKDVLAVLADQREAINKFIYTNKFNISKIGDLMDIVDYYNSL